MRSSSTAGPLLSIFRGSSSPGSHSHGRASSVSRQENSHFSARTTSISPGFGTTTGQGGAAAEKAPRKPATEQPTQSLSLHRNAMLLRSGGDFPVLSVEFSSWAATISSTVSPSSAVSRAGLASTCLTTIDPCLSSPRHTLPIDPT